MTENPINRKTTTTAAHSRSIHNVGVDASIGRYSRIPRGSPGISQKNCAPQHHFSVVLVRNEVLHSLSPASSYCATLALLPLHAITAKGWHSPTGSRTQQVHSSHDIHIHGHVPSRHTQRVFYRPAGRELEHHASRYTYGFLSEKKKKERKKRKKVEKEKERRKSKRKREKKEKRENMGKKEKKRGKTREKRVGKKEKDKKKGKKEKWKKGKQRKTATKQWCGSCSFVRM